MTAAAYDHPDSDDTVPVLLGIDVVPGGPVARARRCGCLTVVVVPDGNPDSPTDEIVSLLRTIASRLETLKIIPDESEAWSFYQRAGHRTGYAQWTPGEESR